jgi:hypothetical protein
MKELLSNKMLKIMTHNSNGVDPTVLDNLKTMVNRDKESRLANAFLSGLEEAKDLHFGSLNIPMENIPIFGGTETGLNVQNGFMW